MILYFTGTGNSRWVAERLAEALQDTAIDISRCLRLGEMPAGVAEAGCVGIVFPIHAWYAPRLLVHYLSLLRLPRECYRYAVCTCGDDVGKGMARLAKHFPLDAAWSVAMPNTYVPLFDLDDEALCRTKVADARQAVLSIAREVAARHRSWKVHEGSAAWLKTYLVNPLFVRFLIRTKGFRVGERCTSCGVCGKSCPLGNIRLAEGRPEWGSRCIHCMACLHACPHGAIQYGEATRKRGCYRLTDYLQG